MGGVIVCLLEVVGAGDRGGRYKVDPGYVVVVDRLSRSNSKRTGVGVEAVRDDSPGRPVGTREQQILIVGTVDRGEPVISGLCETQIRRIERHLASVVQSLEKLHGVIVVRFDRAVGMERHREDRLAAAAVCCGASFGDERAGAEAIELDIQSARFDHNVRGGRQSGVIRPGENDGSTVSANILEEIECAAADRIDTIDDRHRHGCDALRRIVPYENLDGAAADAAVGSHCLYADTTET